jgi:uncharacterized protein YcbK (DUF882 family)
MKYKSKYFANDKKRACPCGCGLDMEPWALAMFDRAREISGVPYNINSGARCETHNRKVNGAKNSAHLRGCAFDISFTDTKNMNDILRGLHFAGFIRIGINLKKNIIHADCDYSLPQDGFNY